MLVGIFIAAFILPAGEGKCLILVVDKALSMFSLGYLQRRLFGHIIIMWLTRPV